MMAIEPKSSRAEGGIPVMRLETVLLNSRNRSTTRLASMPSFVASESGDPRRATPENHFNRLSFHRKPEEESDSQVLDILICFHQLVANRK